MEIDKMEFSFWMKRIMQRFDILSDQMNLNARDRMVLDDEELLDNQDVLHTLKISQRTLQRYRSSGKLKYFTISGKLYYKLSDVRSFIHNSSNNMSPK
ncbi:MAG: helix-turn-helix domain-containing protein [Chryseobacterium sp.]|uniref:helix-turn-helix domain-containing protein n=1 Tax=unclassified Chryseobacterium TaxID=2593645 RepID=UPI0006C8597E|nr:MULTISPECIES: helix-turn-helix domain-containing protein [unclassified Chryseobacterium]AZA54489.1 DNA-binding protein [Chryseobacterium sp. G0201]KPH13315.1 excisionase [Chryseobacterium sp. ERMR1:04]MDN5423048.1 helix-turn-helix domain-containing protein [Chryseobacterium sp.]MDN5477722.1 helix-turn-helix domain-containing protein [Chryseobacterium sp.]